jgi:hypothetical protein
MLDAVKPEEIRLRLGQAFNGPHKAISREYVWKRDAPAMLREIERLRSCVNQMGRASQPGDVAEVYRVWREAEFAT